MNNIKVTRCCLALFLWGLGCFIWSYPAYVTLTLLLLAYLSLELVALVVEAEIRVRIGLSKDKYAVKRVEANYGTTARLRSTYRRPFRWLPAWFLWRVSLWMYFW